MDGEMVMGDQRGEKPRKCACTGCQNRTNRDLVEFHKSINRVVFELDERSRRLFVGLLAKRGGRGAIGEIAVITGMDRKTIRRGLREIGQIERRMSNRVRRSGGGRKLFEKKVLAFAKFSTSC